MRLFIGIIDKTFNVGFRSYLSNKHRKLKLTKNRNLLISKSQSFEYLINPFIINNAFKISLKMLIFIISNI